MDFTLQNPTHYHQRQRSPIPILTMVPHYEIQLSVSLPHVLTHPRFHPFHSSSLELDLYIKKTVVYSPHNWYMVFLGEFLGKPSKPDPYAPQDFHARLSERMKVMKLVEPKQPKDVCPFREMTP
ncbi:unnamed protein product [Lepeophtheirus salmonis]|uniref:(salmon louse) hypothetical protein n=1 Tax=Lepeophtheirus salmonis TaxID=72036 RepID=A0A7R8CW25_LEPSM|nr:unnamed protein product [Lepeophtheirus salmonis]CAF2949776.1 unnamed protein product [Lepeophtheirus salmonis]